MAAHVAACSPGVHEVLKSEWEVESVSPGVADRITLVLAAGAGCVAVHIPSANAYLLQKQLYQVLLDFSSLA